MRLRVCWCLCVCVFVCVFLLEKVYTLTDQAIIGYSSVHTQESGQSFECKAPQPLWSPLCCAVMIEVED